MNQELSDDGIWECIEHGLNLITLSKSLKLCSHELQQQDDKLPGLHNYVFMDLDDYLDEIICYNNNPTKDDWKITLPR